MMDTQYFWGIHIGTDENPPHCYWLIEKWITLWVYPGKVWVQAVLLFSC